MNKEVTYAENWFRLQNIPTRVENNKIYISDGHFEFELSFDEIKNRALCYLESEIQGIENL